VKFSQMSLEERVDYYLRMYPLTKAIELSHEDRKITALESLGKLGPDLLRFLKSRP